MADAAIEEPKEEVVEEVVEPVEEKVTEKVSEEAEPTEEEMVVSIGEESPPQEDNKAPEWVKDVRKRNKEFQKENKELKTKLATFEASKTVELGPKPTLEDSDYDSEKFASELDAWHEKKNQVEASKSEARDEEGRQTKAWQSTLDSHDDKKSDLKGKLKDYDEIEEIVKDTLSPLQQGIILQGAKDSALLVYALGKDPQKLRELSLITDATKFTWAVANMETQVKTNRRPSTQPEKIVNGKGGVASGDSALETLREEAAKTGDYTKVTEYRKKQRKK